MSHHDDEPIIPIASEEDQSSSQRAKLEILHKTTTDRIVELRTAEDAIMQEIEKGVAGHLGDDKISELRSKQSEIHTETEQLSVKLTKIEFDLEQLKQQEPKTENSKH
ncbi:MAG: hypothetical protein WC773_03040 [Patescibacteria group bacterium]|jgi:hypothetical protein